MLRDTQPSENSCLLVLCKDTSDGRKGSIMVLLPNFVEKKMC